MLVSQHENWLTVAGEIGALVAAAAALVAIWFARSTVAEAKKTSEQLGEMGNTIGATVVEQKATTKALTTAHREEMAERARALEAELVVQRLNQLERLSELLTQLVSAALDEYVGLVPQVDVGGRPATHVPAMLIRLQGAVAILARLGGPEITKAEQPGRSAYRGRDALPQLRGQAIDALSEIETLARNDPRLRLPTTGSATTAAM